MSDYKQTLDAAGNVTSQYSQMLQNLNDEDNSVKNNSLVTRLKDWTTVYPEDLEDNDGGLYLKAADRIDELEAQIKEDALQYLSDTGQMGEAVEDLTRRHQHALYKIDVLETEIDVLKAKLEMAVSAIEEMQTASDAMMLHIARTILAELKGQNNE